MTARCRRSWEVEAARDGRLTGQALYAFEQHAKTCRDCSRERAALEGLKRRLAEAAPPTDEVLLRRERDRLLAAADALGRAPAALSYVRWAVAAVAALVLSAGAWLGVRAKLAMPLRDSYAVVTPSAGARWERHQREGVDEIELMDGKLNLAIHRSASDPRVAVRVPDGAIEDLGTEFYVVVREGRTQEIAVQSGAVMFRPRDRGAQLVTTGSVWKLVLPSAPVPVESRPEIAVTGPPRVPHAAHTHRGEHRSGPHAVLPSPSPEIDPSAEDAAFLRIVVLRREHRTDEARAAAAKYLEAFPSGFRRAEVLRFVLSPR